GNLHRGGRTRDAKPLTWDKFFDENRQVDVDGDSFNVYLKGTTGPVFYFLHGGGYSALTWACLATNGTSQHRSRIQCRLLVPDLRGHGLTHTQDDKDLSAERQTRDIIGIYNAVFGGECEEDPPLLTFLRGRPSTFESEEKAVTWCLQSGATRNREAARISMPSQIKKTEDGKYTWRINLMDTEPFWVGWFQGLSAKFLSCTPPKLLVLAGVDRLDKDLTIAQMQGKFQNTILPKVGHAVHEDSPDRLADELARFALRHRFAEAVPGARPLAAHPMMGMGMMI
ncbi:hypothetical protein OSTOST_22226, partial [Ostertagia ostertagi]